LDAEIASAHHYCLLHLISAYLLYKHLVYKIFVCYTFEDNPCTSRGWREDAPITEDDDYGAQ